MILHFKYNDHDYPFYTTVKRFPCPNNPWRCCWRHYAPGRVCYDEQARQSIIKHGHLCSPYWHYCGSILESGLGLGLAGKHLLARSLPTRPGGDQPKMATSVHLQVGSLPAGMSMRG